VARLQRLLVYVVLTQGAPSLRSLQGWVAILPTQLLFFCAKSVAHAFVVPALCKLRKGRGTSGPVCRGNQKPRPTSISRFRGFKLGKFCGGRMWPQFVHLPDAATVSTKVGEICSDKRNGAVPCPLCIPKN